MDQPQETQEDLVTRFFSRKAQREVAALIKDTYTALIECAFMSSQFNEDDLEFAREYADSNNKNDLSKACKLFDFVRLGYSDSASRLNTPRLIVNVQSRELSRKMGKSEQELQNLVGQFFEFRACCLALLQHRHSLAHDSESRISFVQAAFLCSCFTRAFEISRAVHSALEREFAHLAALERYTKHLEEFFGFQHRGGDETESKTDEINDVHQTILLLHEIAESVRPLGEAIDALSDENSKTLASFDDALQRGNAQLMAKIDEVSEWLNTSKVQEVLVEAEEQSLPQPAHKEPESISKPEAEQALVSLRDQIFSRMAREIEGFKHYHNVLQRLLIHAALSAQCRNSIL